MVMDSMRAGPRLFQTGRVGWELLTWLMWACCMLVGRSGARSYLPACKDLIIDWLGHVCWLVGQRLDWGLSGEGTVWI